MRRISDRRAGFTVVELVVAMAITTIIAIGLVSLIVSLVGSATRSIETTKQVHEVQSALSTIRTDLRLSNNFLATSPVADTDRDGNNWNYRGSGENNRTLLLQRRAVHGTSVAQNRLPLFQLELIDYPGFGCLSTNPDHTPFPGFANTSEPAYGTIIYYLHDSNLYRRVTVAQPLTSGTACPGNTSDLVRTCPDPTASSRPSNCHETDVLLAQNVERFDILYYTNPGDQTAIADIFASTSGQGNLDGISTIQVKIQTSKDIDGRQNQFTSQIRANRGSAL